MMAATFFLGLWCEPEGVTLPGKHTLCVRLLDWVDAAVVYHKKGAVGLLRYTAAVGVLSQTVKGIPFWSNEARVARNKLRW